MVLWMNNQDILKRKAAENAVEYIKSGMKIGFGTGSTFNHVLYVLADKIKSGAIKDIVGISSSDRTEQLAKELKIPTAALSKFPNLDITIDGADEVDEKLNLIKGGGAAHLREKIIAQASNNYIIIVDESKVVKHLGEKWAVPIEVIKMALDTELQYLKSIGAEVSQRLNSDGTPLITDEGNFILDANFGIIKNPKKLAKKLEKRAGIVEHGLFVNMAKVVVVATKDGIKVFRNNNTKN